MDLVEFFDNTARDRKGWISRNSYYYIFLKRLIKAYVDVEGSVLEIGSGTGTLIKSLKNKVKIGIDFSSEMVTAARKHSGDTQFERLDVQKDRIGGKYDWIIADNLVGYLSDIHKSFENLKNNCNDETRILVVYHNHLWWPVLKLGELIGLRSRQPEENWLGTDDLKNLFEILGFEVIRIDNRLLIPFYIPIISALLNDFVATLPIFKHLSLIQLMILRVKPIQKKEYTVSIIVPARNEEGNIPKIVKSIPKFGKKQELIFIEGHSQDQTWSAIQRVKDQHSRIKISAYKQRGIGKADAVRLGFEKASCEVLMILDADLSVNPNDLIKFYAVVRDRKGEFINGSRLVYPIQKDAMRYLNKLGNKLFSILFTYLLGQRYKDTLCGTKVMLCRDYEKINRLRALFGKLDPFGDFDLIFGAAKLCLKTVEIPVRYRPREYGVSNIKRFSHGWKLLLMTLKAFEKFIWI